MVRWIPLSAFMLFIIDTQISTCLIKTNRAKQCRHSKAIPWWLFLHTLIQVTFRMSTGYDHMTRSSAYWERGFPWWSHSTFLYFFQYLHPHSDSRIADHWWQRRKRKNRKFSLLIHWMQVIIINMKISSYLHMQAFVMLVVIKFGMHTLKKCDANMVLLWSFEDFWLSSWTWSMGQSLCTDGLVHNWKLHTLKICPLNNRALHFGPTLKSSGLKSCHPWWCFNDGCIFHFKVWCSASPLAVSVSDHF